MQTKIIEERGRETMIALFKRLFYEEDAASAVEYGLIAALIAVVLIIAVTALGGSLRVMFENINDAIEYGVGENK